jgi:CubicO group peptidase (beta-lactamase class C family)
VAKAEFSGVRLVARRGKLVDVDSAGFADLEADLQWTAQTCSQIASISKQFAAAVALLLVDRGALTLDDPVARMLAGASPQWSDVAVHQLLTHTSGMNHWCELPGFDPAVQLDPADRLTELLTAPLVDPPGRRWRYSSPGYIVLSAVLESAAATRYADLVHDLIIRRLGLRDTTVGKPRSSGMARGYRGGQPVTPWDLHTMPGTGDIWSTAEDLTRFLTALHTGGLLSVRAQATFHEVAVPCERSPHPTSALVTTAYGLGHFIGSTNGHLTYLCPGDNPGYQSLAAWLPATATTVVALSNDENGDIEAAVTEALADAAR